MSWQKNIIEGRPQTIICIINKKIRCTFTIPSIACLKCKHYITKKNGPGAI